MIERFLFISFQKNKTFSSKKPSKSTVSDFWNVHWKLRMGRWCQQDGLGDTKAHLPNKNNLKLGKIAQGKLWITMKKEHKTCKAQILRNDHIAKFRKPITYITSFSRPEKLGARRYSLRELSPHGDMECRRIPAGLTTVDRGLPQCLPMLIPADRAAYSALLYLLLQGRAVAVGRPACGGSSHCYVLLPSIRTPQHLTI